MYADQMSSGRKRSIKERLHGDLGGDFSRSSVVPAKRQRQDDDKWKHDLYDGEREPETFKSVNPNDLRWKLQKRGSQQPFQSKVSVVRDLRDKLTGTMHSQPSNSEPSKAKRVSEISETIKKNLRNDPLIPETKKVVTNPKKTSQSKAELSVDGFLNSLGLGKYSITFQAEEVDMTALKHMNDEDLRALGIPMGPRKKILLSLESRA